MHRTFLPLLFLLFLATGLRAQSAQFPTPTIADVDFAAVDLGEVIGQGKPTVVAVWATWCQPCHLELDHMKAYLDKWTGEYGARVLAVSVDRRHMVNRIKPLVKRKGWPYEILVDTDGKLQSVLGFRSIPQLYVLDGDGKIVREFTGYQSGREAKVDALIRRLASK